MENEVQKGAPNIIFPKLSYTEALKISNLQSISNKYATFNAHD